MFKKNNIFILNFVNYKLKYKVSCKNNMYSVHYIYSSLPKDSLKLVLAQHLSNLKFKITSGNLQFNDLDNFLIHYNYLEFSIELSGNKNIIEKNLLSYPKKKNYKYNHNDFNFIKEVKFIYDCNKFSTFLINEEILNTYLNTKNSTTFKFNKYNYKSLEIVFDNENYISTLYSEVDFFLKKNNLNINYKHLIISDFLMSIVKYSSFKINKDDSIRYNEIQRVSYLNLILIRENLYSIKNYCFLHQKFIILLKIKKLINYREARSIKNSVKFYKNIYMSINIFIGSYYDDIDIHSFKYFINIINNVGYCINNYRNYIICYRKNKTMCSVNFLDKKAISNSLNTTFYLSSYFYNLNSYIFENKLNEKKKKYSIESLDDFYKISNYRKKDDYTYIVNLFTLYSNIKLDTEFYLPTFVDSRGRLYYSTIYSPTFNKIIRGFITIKQNFDISNKVYIKELESSKYYKIIIKYKYMLKDIINNNIDNNKIYFLIVLFIELGKKNINKDLNNYETKTEKIISMGIQRYLNKFTLSDDMYDNNIYNSIRLLICNNILNTELTVWRDATASGLQNFLLVYGFKECTLKYLNMDGDLWIDTYSYIINKYTKETIKKKHKEIFLRKYFKKTIMTIPYKVTLRSARKYFKDGLADNNYFKELSELEKKEVILEFDEFFKSVNNYLMVDMYNYINNDKFEKFEYVSFKLLSQEEYKINFLNSRHKYTNSIVVEKPNEKKFLTAETANNMHYLDSKLIHELHLNNNIISIHDCIGMNITSVHKIMDQYNNYYCLRIGKKIYGTHIII